MTDLSVQPVLFEKRRAANGARIGVARLNAEKTLNALSLEIPRCSPSMGDGEVSVWCVPLTHARLPQSPTLW